MLRKCFGRFTPGDGDLSPSRDDALPLRQIKRLKKTGRADLLIGCIALAHRATVVTRNYDHFRQIPGLKIENWVD